jgi:hypothetical protein
MSVANVVKENEDLSFMLKNEIESVMQKLEGSGACGNPSPCPPNNTIFDSSSVTRDNLKMALNYIHTVNTLLYGDGPSKTLNAAPPLSLIKNSYTR